jgi:hypothetical protein
MFDENLNVNPIGFYPHSMEITKLFCIDKYNALVSASVDGNIGIISLFNNGSIN